jgi:hypothetical protein
MPKCYTCSDCKVDFDQVAYFYRPIKRIHPIELRNHQQYLLIYKLKKLKKIR